MLRNVIWKWSIGKRKWTSKVSWQLFFKGLNYGKKTLFRKLLMEFQEKVNYVSNQRIS